MALIRVRFGAPAPLAHKYNNPQQTGKVQFVIGHSATNGPRAVSGVAGDAFCRRPAHTAALSSLHARRPPLPAALDRRGARQCVLHRRFSPTPGGSATKEMPSCDKAMLRPTRESIKICGEPVAPAHRIISSCLRFHDAPAASDGALNASMRVSLFSRIACAGAR